MAKRTGMAKQLREAARRLDGGRGSTFTAAELSNEMGLQTYSDQDRMHRTINDFKKRGELVSRGRGAYRLVRTEPNKQQIMWNAARSMRRFTPADLVQIASVSEAYAREFIQNLMRHGVVRGCGRGAYVMVKDVVEMPANERKHEQLRELRERSANLEATKNIVIGAMAACQAMIAEIERIQGDHGQADSGGAECNG